MISWQSIAIALLSVAGVACCGIGAIALLAAGHSCNAEETAKAERGGCIIGSAGLVLLAVAFLVKLS